MVNGAVERSANFFSLPTAYGKGEGDLGALKPKGKFRAAPSPRLDRFAHECMTGLILNCWRSLRRAVARKMVRKVLPDAG